MCEGGFEILLSKANGLELYRIRSKVESIIVENLKDAISKFNSNGFYVAYLDHRVVIGRIISNKLESYNDKIIEEKYIQKMRIFNEQKELLIWRNQGNLKGRFRIDGEGEEAFVVNSFQLLWGTDKHNLGNNWIKVYEKRGTELILPLGDVNVDNRKNRLFLKSRNYIDFHPETHQATYSDCRFLGFKAGPF